MELTDRDIDFIRQTGRDPDAVRRQLLWLRDRAFHPRITRACGVDDGIERLDPARHDALEAACVRAASAGRLMGFVPASGAASRLFASLYAAWRGREPDDVASRVLSGLRRLALWPAVADRLRSRGHEPDALVDSGRYGPVLDVIFDDLALSDLPKGLLPFHRYDAGARTAFEEHLVELTALAASQDRRVRAHFTVSADHRGAFERALRDAGARLDVTLDVAFSVQDPATDTVAVEESGALLRDGTGHPVFRPGGHGALLGNLQACGGDVVLVENVDNVVPDAARPEVLAWRRRLVGRLLEVQATAHDLLGRLDRSIPEARDFVVHTLGVLPDADADLPTWLADRLDRPFRVCGMVPNQGQPGGGPFWALDGEGRVTRQIVEAAQIDRQDPEQARLLGAASHFNPVEMVLGLRDRHGTPYDLTRFVDPRAVIVTDKTHEGRPIRVIERPGLWNGGMAGWNTLFVEVPPVVFNPVKTLADLLDAPHGG